MDNDLIIFAFGVCLGFAMHWGFILWVVNRWIREYETELEQVQEEESNQLTVRIEENGNVFFFYNTETNQFVLQASTPEEMTEKLGQMPGNPTLVVHGDRDVIERFEKNEKSQ